MELKNEEKGKLFCQENFDGTQNDCYNETLDAALDFNRELLICNSSEKQNERNESKFRVALDQEDVKLINELGQLSAGKLMEYIRTLQNTSVSLSEEEALQFAKTRCLQIFK